MRKIEKLKSRYYTIEDIKVLEHCGKDMAYEIAEELPHGKRTKNCNIRTRSNQVKR